jgi:hypothetical protein
MQTKAEHYVPKIKDGLPPVRSKTAYPRKIVEGELIRIAEQIRHGQYVEISQGSLGKLTEIIKNRGLTTVARVGQDKNMRTVYVVTPQWLAENPEA